jgi:hypothetical protein
VHRGGLVRDLGVQVCPTKSLGGREHACFERIVIADRPDLELLTAID